MKKFLLLALLFACSHPLLAAVFTIPNGDVAALVAAINAANANGQADVINLALNGTYVFTAINTTVTGQPFGYHETEGPVASPVILNEQVPGVDLTINLNGSVLRLGSTAPKMRLFQSGSDVSWRLNGGTIKDFESPVNNPVAAHGGGGGAAVSGQRNVFTSESMTFDNCTSNSREERSGGALSVGGGSQVTLKNSTYKNNTGSTYGGAITVLLSDVRIENCLFDNNKCTVGGGAALYVDGCKGVLSTNEPGGLGELIGCTFVNNTSLTFGAVFLQGYFEDQWVVKNSQFTNNKATQAGGMAGALWHSGLNNGRFDVSTSTFENNEARTHGGAITCTRGANNFTNCTFSGNLTRDAGGLGGGIYNIGETGSTWFSTITNCTFANNTAGGYGGAWCITDSQGSVKNTIVANNRAYQQCGYPPPAGCVGYNNANNCAGRLADNGSNIEYPERPKRVANPGYDDPNDQPCFPRAVVVNSNLMPVANPLLSPPANNGGPTRTVALQAGSPAIDAGSGCPATDQRGAPRIGACDIGAYEFGAAVLALAAPARPGKLGLYPNPSTGEVFLTLPPAAAPGPVHVRVYAPSGQLVLEQVLDPRPSIPLRVPSKGLFLLQATVGTQRYTQRLVVQ